MAVVCPVCREVVHVSAGYVVRHGVRHHLSFVECSASGTPYLCIEDGCCG